MHLRHTLVVAPDEPEEDFGIDPAGVFVDVAHDAEVVRDDIAVGRDLEIALMHVGVEVAVAQGVAEKELQHPLRQRGTVVPGRINRARCRPAEHPRPSSSS